MPGCLDSGDYKAPKDRSLSEYYHFCHEHITEYNKAWDFFQGMNASEIEDHIIRSATWDRPTRKFSDFDMEDKLRSKAWDFYNGDKESSDKSNGNSYHRHEDRNTPEFEALAIMGLEPPVDLKEIKTKYKSLAKKYHPDLNQNDPKAEDLLKSINMAYTILKLAYEKYDELEKDTR